MAESILNFRYKIATEAPNLTYKDADALSNAYKQFVFAPKTRTLWWQGKNYGTAYQANTKNDSISGDVFGKYDSHSISKAYALVSGTGNTVISNDNEFVTGTYNYDAAGKSYIFVVGNGKSDTTRSNAFSVDDKGTVIAYQIEKTKLDTSYVSSLGSAATMNVVMSSLLTSANNYHYPKIKLNINNGEQHILVSNKSLINTISLSCALNSNVPQIGTKYVETYINKYNKLPSGVTTNNFGYTNCLRNGSSKNYSTHYDSAIQYSFNVNTSFNDSTKRMVSTDVSIYSHQLNADSESTTTYPYGKNVVSYSFYIGTGTPNSTTFNLPSMILPHPGYYEIANINFNVSYDSMQKLWFPQLANKDVYVLDESSAYKWNNNNLYTNVSATSTVYVGYNLIYGIFSTSEAEPTEQTEDVIKNVLLNKSQTGISIDKRVYLLVDCKKNTDYMPTTQSQEVFFGSTYLSSNFTNGKQKYFFYSFPTAYFNITPYTNNNTDYFKIKPSSMANRGAMSKQTHYTFNITDNTITGGATFEYTTYVGAIAADNIVFNSTNSRDGQNISFKVNQKNLNTKFS